MAQTQEVTPRYENLSHRFSSLNQPSQDFNTILKTDLQLISSVKTLPPVLDDFPKTMSTD
jgi:hypothetical protein